MREERSPAPALPTAVVPAGSTPVILVPGKPGTASEPKADETAEEQEQAAEGGDPGVGHHLHQGTR